MRLTYHRNAWPTHQTSTTLERLAAPQNNLSLMCACRAWSTETNPPSNHAWPTPRLVIRERHGRTVCDITLVALWSCKASLHSAAKEGGATVQREKDGPQCIKQISKAFQKYEREVTLVDLSKEQCVCTSWYRDRLAGSERHATEACDNPPHENTNKKPSRDSD